MERKNILITGASSGIGKCVAEYLHSQGNTVILVARNEEKLNKLAKKLGDNAYIYPYDLINLKNIGEIFEFCINKGLKLDGMVHSAGINKDMPIKVNDISAMNETMTINCLSFLELGKYFCKKKVCNDNASIVALSSTASKKFGKGMSTYVASKAALNGIVKVMSKEYITRKIRVNAILPAFVKTEMMERTKEFVKELDERVSKSQQLGVIEPIQVAYLSEFLLSEKSKYITGSLIPITAGLEI